jgi:hypothetical protein
MLAATAVAMGSMVAITAGTASATAAQCAHGANGFVDISNSLSGDIVAVDDPDLGFVRLETGTVGGVKRGWAMVDIGGTSPLTTADSVWMDWSQDGGRTWLQCGPFNAQNGMRTITSAAKATNPSPNWVFRAGGFVAGYQRLTGWY